MIDNKKEKIFAAVFNLFREGKNVRTIKVSEIAERAGIGKGSVYLYFASKDDVIIEAVQYFLNTWLKPFEEYIIDSSIDFKKSMMQFIDLHIELAEEYYHLLSSQQTMDYVSVFNSETLPGTIEVVKKARKKHLDKLEELLNVGRQQKVISYINRYSINVVAESIMLMMKYLSFREIIDEEKTFTADECKELTYDMILRVCR